MHSTASGFVYMVSEDSVCAAPHSSIQLHVLPSLWHLQELSYCLLTCTYGLSYADSLVQLQSKLSNRALLEPVWLCMSSDCPLLFLCCNLSPNLTVLSCCRGYINYYSVYLFWLGSAVFVHLPSFQSMGIDVKADISMLLTIFLLSLLVRPNNSFCLSVKHVKQNSCLKHNQQYDQLQKNLNLARHHMHSGVMS